MAAATTKNASMLKKNSSLRQDQDVIEINQLRILEPLKNSFSLELKGQIARNGI
jgi:hypothetical protein